MNPEQKIKSLNSQDQIFKKIYNIEAEQYVLGAIMNNNQNISKIDISPKHFFEPLHQRLFAKFLEFDSKGLEINPILLKSSFSEDGDLKELGGVNYLLKLCSLACGILNIRDYAQLIRNLSDRRHIYQVLQKKLNSLHQDIESGTHEIIEDINREFIELQSVSSQYRLTSFESVVLDISVDCLKSTESAFTSTGSTKINKTMKGGLQRSKTYAIAAPPKDGKTMLKGTITNHIRKQRDKKILFIAAEMNPKEIAKRMIGEDLGISSDEISLDNMEFVRYANNIAVEKANNLFFINAPRITLQALVASITNASRTKNIEGVVLDYLQLVTGKNPKDTIAQHQEDVAQTIAELAKKLNIWVLYSCQINRKGEVRNGDGIEMAVDWLYEINKISRPVAPGAPEQAWLKHIATRNFKGMDIGCEADPAFELSINGTHFIEL